MSRATTRPVTLQTRTHVPLISIPTMSTSRHVWRYSRVSPRMACLTKVARHCHKTCTHKLINLARLALRPGRNGVRMPRLRRREVRHQVP